MNDSPPQESLLLTHEEEDILFQAMVAFGQGSDMRVAREAVRVIADRYAPLIRSKELTKTWATDAVQALERIRAIGRRAASTATTAGRTFVNAEDVQEAIPAIESVSMTTICD